MSETSLLPPAERDLVIDRFFAAPPELVFRLWTDPVHALRWWGPRDHPLTRIEMDVRPGGKYRWRWRSDDNGKEFGFFGEFSDVDAPGKLAHTEYYDPGDVGGAMPTANPARIRTTFTEKNGVTTLVTLMDFGSKELRDAAVSTGMTDGMEMGYERLDVLFAEVQGG